MRYAIFSDIHSNLEGLHAVLAEAGRLGADALLCCGDIVGYNADPNACVERVRQERVRCIQGNHERALRDLEEGIEPDMNPIAMEALRFTARTLTASNRDWLASLPDERVVDNTFHLFHGSPSHPDEYIFDPSDAARAFMSLASHYAPPANLLCFIGHTHVCAAYALDPQTSGAGERAPVADDRFQLQTGIRYMLNAGSCGQYRGGLPASTMCLFDSGDMTVDFRFLAYDVASTQGKIIVAGLPAFLAQRLVMGQ